jgi:hypothetical protein
VSNLSHRPVISDKATDDDIVRQLKDKLRLHLDDYLNLVETQPKLIEDWKASRDMDDGQWRNPEDCAEAERIRVAAYSHFMARHPHATVMDASSAYASYMCFVRGRWVEGSH